MIRWIALGLLVLSAPADVWAQTSVYSVLGLGFPGRGTGARSRALGGGLMAVDPASSLNPAAVAAYTQLSMSITSTASFRNYSVNDSSVGGLLDTRFAFASLGGPFGGSRLAFGLTYASYLDRTFDVRDSGVVVVQGDTLRVLDQVRSDGGVVDLRGAVGWQLSSALRVGAAVHILSGVTENVFRRQFSDSAYAPFARSDRVTFTGVGGSAGIMLTPRPWVRLGGAARLSSDMTAKLASDEIAGTKLPLEVSGGFFVAPAPSIRIASTTIWRSWSDAQADLPAGARAFDTWEVGSGVEFAGPRFGRTALPLRLGFRWAQLPFSSSDEQATEMNMSAGSAISMGGGRATFEVALERVVRDGAGAKERAWQLTLELRLIP